ncbi:MAG: tetratricopeptide repeat protein [Bacteroidota bacterium]|nr:tetratricopeptide repeat protein [Bacteroidota bacterium]
MASEQRIQKLQEMLVNDPNDSFTRYALAMEHVGSNNPTEAIEILNDIVKRDSKYLPAYHQLGILFGKLNRTQEAKTAYRHGIDLAGQLGETKEEKEMREELEELEDEW